MGLNPPSTGLHPIVVSPISLLNETANLHFEVKLLRHFKNSGIMTESVLELLLGLIIVMLDVDMVRIVSRIVRMVLT